MFARFDDAEGVPKPPLKDVVSVTDCEAVSEQISVDLGAEADSTPVEIVSLISSLYFVVISGQSGVSCGVARVDRQGNLCTMFRYLSNTHISPLEGVYSTYRRPEEAIPCKIMDEEKVFVCAHVRRDLRLLSMEDYSTLTVFVSNDTVRSQASQFLPEDRSTQMTSPKK